jgi:DnaK suppressor protein
VDPKRATERLQAERSRIEQALAELHPSPPDELADVDQHVADEGSELFDEERDAGLAEGLREELAAIERAERRLAEGTYGLSVQSGEPIPDGRLRSIPWAERTAEEQARLESGR